MDINLKQRSSLAVTILFYAFFPEKSFAAQLVANNTTQTANGTYNTSPNTGTAGYALWALNNGTINNNSLPLTLITSGNAAHAVVAQSGGKINLSQFSTISVNGLNSYGLSATGAGSVINGNNLAITIGPLGSYGISVTSGASINLSGTTSIQKSGTSTGYGVYSSGAGSQFSADLLNLTMGSSASSAHGVYAENGGSVILRGGTVVVNTLQSKALFAFNNNATLSATDVNVITSGSQGIAVEANSNSTISLIRGSVSTSGSMAYGLYAISSTAHLTADGTVIETFGNGALGAYALEASMSLANISVTTHGVNSHAAEVDNANPAAPSNTLSITNGIFRTIGANSNGLMSLGKGILSGLNLTVETSGNSSSGAAAQFGGKIELTQSNINTAGTSSPGLFAVAQSNGVNAIINASNVSITTTGTSAAGVLARSGGEINLSDSLVDTYGANAYGISSSLYTPDLTGISTANLTRSTINAHNAAAINTSSGILNSSLSDTTVTGNGVLLQTINNGTLNLVANRSNLTGAAQTDAGSTSNVTLNANTQWNMSDTSVLTSLVNSQSRIAYLAPVNGIYKTLTVNNYSGDSGSILLNTYLGDDQSPSDLFVINGGSAIGSTRLEIMNTAGQGALTSGDGILVVDTINGGTTNAGAFSLGGVPVVAGPFEYSLYRSGIDGDNAESWYLRSVCPLSNPNCSSEPPPIPVPDDQPHYRREVGLYPVLPAMMLLYGQTLIDTLHQRVGHDYWPNSDTVSKSTQRIWSRITGLHGERDRLNNRTLIESSEYDYNFASLQFGGDIIEHTTTQGARHHLGLTGAYGRGNGEVKRPEFSLGRNQFTAYSIGGYWTIYSPTEAYIDTVVQTTWYSRTQSQSVRLRALETEGWGIGTSVEAGYPILLKQKWMVEPQSQLIYQAINLKDGRDIGATIRFTDVNSLIGRLGVRFAHKYQFGQNDIKQLTTWIRPNYWYQFKGNPKAQFSSAYGYIPFQSELKGSTMEFNLGTTLDLPRNLVLFANGSYGVGVNIHATSYNGEVGFKVKLA